MKFVHLSDLHLGKRLNGFSMLEDQEYILDQILQIIDSEHPDAVLIAGDIYDKLSRSLGIKGGECTPDGKFSLEACRCIGACGLAPVMTINDDVYGRLSVDEIEGILAKYQD